MNERLQNSVWCYKYRRICSTKWGFSKSAGCGCKDTPHRRPCSNHVTKGVATRNKYACPTAEPSLDKQAIHNTQQTTEGTLYSAYNKVDVVVFIELHKCLSGWMAYLKTIMETLTICKNNWSINLATFHLNLQFSLIVVLNLPSELPVNLE